MGQRRAVIMTVKRMLIVAMQELAQKILNWEWLIMAAMIPLVLFGSGAVYSVLLLIPALWALRWLATGHILPPSPMTISVLALLVMVGVSLTATFDMSLSLPKIATILLGIGLFSTATSYARSHAAGLWPVLVFVLVAGTGMAIVGFFTADWPAELAVLGRARDLLPPALATVPGTVGGVVNANELGGALAWVVPLMVACLIGLWNRPSRYRGVTRVLLLAGSVITIAVTLATLSRGSILAIVLGLVLVLSLFMEPRWRLVLVAGLVVGTVALYLTLRTPAQAQDLLGDYLGLQGRLEIWSRALLGMADFPLTGMSVNGFREVVGVLYPLFLFSPELDLAHAHNHILQVGLDLGIPGMVAYLSIWVLSVRMLYQSLRTLKRRHRTDSPYFAVAAGLSGSLVAGWTFGLFDTVALGARPTFIWWLLIGLVAASHYAIVVEGRSRARRRKTRPVEYESQLADLSFPALETHGGSSGRYRELSGDSLRLREVDPDDQSGSNPFAR